MNRLARRPTQVHQHRLPPELVAPFISELPKKKSEILGGPVEGCPVEGCPVEGCPVEGCPVEGCPVEGCPVEGCPVEMGCSGVSGSVQVFGDENRNRTKTK